MWSDRLAAGKRQEIEERLRAVLPAPRPGSRGTTTPLTAGRGAPSPEQVAEALRRQPGFSWLDAGPGVPSGQHRLLARPLVTLQVRNHRARVKGPLGSVSFPVRGFDLLEAALSAWRPEGEGAGRRALLVGYLGYELGRDLEKLPPPPEDDLGFPDLHLALYDRSLHWDGQGWLLESTDAWQEDGAPDPVSAAQKILKAAGRLAGTTAPHEITAAGPVFSRPNQAGFEIAVQRTVHRIHRGQICQVNLCRRLEAELPAAEIWPFYQRLRAASPAEYGSFVDLGRGRAVMSVSPELFLRLREGVAESRPIKGTRPRGADARQDEVLARELTQSAKDGAELAMIVDVTRNDLGRVCAAGTVEVVRHADLMTLPTLHHTVSTVRGRLRPGYGACELLRAAFPAASITGAPKIQAMDIANREEERRRGPAMGAHGWISLAGELELAVSIRTAAAARGRIAYHAGCGIVADSRPYQELTESAVKARAFLRALGAPEQP